MFTRSISRARQAGIATTIALVVTLGIASPAFADGSTVEPDAAAAEAQCSTAVDALLTTDLVAENIPDPESSTVQYLCAADAIQLTEVTSDPAPDDYVKVRRTQQGNLTRTHSLVGIACFRWVYPIGIKLSKASKDLGFGRLTADWLVVFHSVVWGKCQSCGFPKV